MNSYERFMAELYCPTWEQEQHLRNTGLTGMDDVKRPSRLLGWLSRLASRLAAEKRKPAVKAQNQGAIISHDTALRKAG